MSMFSGQALQSVSQAVVAGVVSTIGQTKGQTIIRFSTIYIISSVFPCLPGNINWLDRRSGHHCPLSNFYFSDTSVYGNPVQFYI